eukprot:2632351-Prorocentrum_lima.AAC.1
MIHNFNACAPASLTLFVLHPVRLFLSFSPASSFPRMFVFVHSFASDAFSRAAVSYTHLTLPTICSV